MEIGLRAKVKPDVDRRSVKKSASRLRSSFEESLEDLEVAVEMDDVVTRIEDMQGRVEEVSEHTQDAAEGAAEMQEALDEFNLDALDKIPDDDIAMDIMFGDAPAMPSQGGDEGGGGGGLQQGLQTVSQARENPMSFLGDQMGGVTDRLGGLRDTMSGVGSKVGGVATKLGAGVAIGGLAMLALSGIWSGVEKFSGHSPLLGAVVDMLGLALTLFFMPFGHILGRLLLPIVTTLLELAAAFNRFMFTAFEKGLIDGVAYLLAGLANMVLSVEGSTIRNIAAVGAGLLLLRKMGAKAILKRLIPTAGGFTGKLLARLGIAGLGSRILAVFKGIGGRVLGALGLKGFASKLLARMGLKALAARIAGRLAGSLVPMLNIVLWGDLIFELIFGFSPIFDYLIPAIIDGLKWFLDGILWVAGGIIDALGGVVNWLMGLSLSGIMGFGGQMLGAGIDVVVAVLQGIAWVLGGLFDIFSSVWTWILSVLGPFVDLLQPVGMILGIFAILGLEVFALAKEGWNLLMEFLRNPGEALKGAFDAALDFGTMAIGELIDGTIELGQWMWSGAVGLGKWLWSGAVTLGKWLWSGAVTLGTWLWSGAVTLGKWLWSGAVTLGRWLWSGAVTLGKWLWSGTVTIGRWLVSGTVGLGKWLWSGTVTLGKWLWSGATTVGKWLWSGATGLGQWMWSGAVTLGQWLFSGAVAVGKWLFSGAVTIWNYVSNVKEAIWDYVSGVKMAIWNYVMDSNRAIWNFVDYVAKTIWDWIDDINHDIWKWVNTPNIKLWDYVDIPTINLGKYIKINGIDFAAQGAAVTKPTVAAVGEGGESEVIVPYSKIPGFVSNMMSGMKPDKAIPGSINKLATGGIATSSMLAMIGEGRESEAVLPLSKLDSMLSGPTQPGPGGGGQSMEVTIDVNQATGGEDGGDLASAVEEALGSRLDDIAAGVDELARKIRDLDTDRPIKITADGKVLAEVDARGNDKYKRSRDITK